MWSLGCTHIMCTVLLIFPVDLFSVAQNPVTNLTIHQHCDITIGAYQHQTCGKHLFQVSYALLLALEYVVSNFPIEVLTEFV